jgi:arginyl-tRNA synthetase
VITAELRRAIAAAAGQPGADPLLRPGPRPGSYASSLPFRLARPGGDPRAIAADLAARLEDQPWIAAAEATGPGYLTVTVTRDALAGLAVRITRAGPACAASDALRGRAVPAPAETDPAAEPDWPRARAALAAQLTARLAAAAGATLTAPPAAAAGATLTAPPAAAAGATLTAPLSAAADGSLTAPLSAAADGSLTAPPAAAADGSLTAPPAAAAGATAIFSSERTAVPRSHPAPLAAAVAYAGPDAVRFALARMPPGGVPPQPTVIARHVLENPAYAVRYAHAAAAAVLRWAAALGTGPGEFRPRLLAGPEELALLDGLSWLPERVAMAARRGRPDEFAGYLERLAARTIETMSTSGFTTISNISSERLWLADAARTGLAAGLELLRVGAPRRL